MAEEYREEVLNKDKLLADVLGLGDSDMESMLKEKMLADVLGLGDSDMESMLKEKMLLAEKKLGDDSVEMAQHISTLSKSMVDLINQYKAAFALGGMSLIVSLHGDKFDKKDLLMSFAGSSKSLINNAQSVLAYIEKLNKGHGDGQQVQE